MRLHSGFLVPAAAAVLMSGLLQAQRPPVPVAVPPDQVETPPDQPQGGVQTKPLTEAEEREKQIRQFDPRARPATEDSRTDDSRTPSNLGDALDAPTPANPATTVRQAQPALPGSVANRRQQQQQNPRAAGPRVEDQNSNNSADRYTGPAVLTRSYTLQGAQLAQQVRWRYSLGLNEVYDSTSSILGLPGANTARGLGRIGQQYTWAFSGRHLWRKDALSVSYLGSYDAYPAQNLRGSNHSLSANYSRVVARRMSFNLGLFGSSLGQGFSLENPVTNAANSLADVNIAASPAVQLFDSTTRQVSVSPSLQWQKSARLSFSFGGSWFGVEREGFGLLGQTGYQALTDVNYRLTRRITTGAYYSATFYRFTHGVATSDAHGTGLILSAALDRSTELRLRGGINFFENDALTVVKIDPAIAALLGTSQGVIDQYNRTRFTEASAELARDLHHNRTAILAYSRGLAPGNGQILASIQQAATAGFTVLVLRKYLVSTGGGWTTLKSQASGQQAAYNYDTQYVFMGLSRPAGRRAQTNLRFDYRRFTITTAEGTPDQLRISLGVNWNSTEGPLRLW